MLLLMTNPVAIYTSGLAWNHDLPAFLTVGAFVLFCRGIESGKANGWIFASGLLLGLAIGTRLAVATAIVPFALGLLILPMGTTPTSRVRLIALFVLGVALGLLPSLALFAAAPTQFVFGNLGYHELNQQFMQAADYNRTMTLGDKLSYARDVATQPGTIFAFATFLMIALLVALGMIWVRSTRAWEALLAVALFLFVLVGSLAPTPTWYQYFYAPLPFLVLAVFYGASSIIERVGSKAGWGLLLLVPAVAASLLNGLPSYSNWQSIFSPQRWVSVQVHDMGEQVAARSTAGDKVLTLAPLVPLEGGGSIYKEFATGPFAWRSAPLLSDADRKSFGSIPLRTSNNICEQTSQRLCSWDTRATWSYL